MAFDPDVFLLEEDEEEIIPQQPAQTLPQSTGFDPDAFLAEEEEPEFAQPAPAAQPAYQYDPSGFRRKKPVAVEPKPEEQGILRQVADIPLGIARGGVTGIKMMTDILGADNAVSKSLAGVEGYMADLMSAQAKEDQQEISRIMKDAEDKGFGEQVKAGIKAFSIAPVDIMSQALGTMAPVIATGLAGSAAKLGALGMRAVQAGVGAGMGAGMIKGEIYNEVKNELVNSGIAEDAAEKAAVDAQSYGGKNLDQILLGAGLGAASTLGAEGIITRILTKQGTAPAAGVVSRVLKGGLTEAAPEAAQAAQEQLAKNVALQREGFDVDPSRGVVAAATMEAVAAAPLGGIAGAVEKPAPIKTLAEENLEQTNEIARKVAENGAPLTASAIQDQAATNLRQDELAKQLEAQLEEELVAVKKPTAAAQKPMSKDEFKAIYSQVAPEELDAAEAGFTEQAVTDATEEGRISAQNALEAIKEIKATVTPPAPPVEPAITPAVTPAVPTAQPPITDATQEIIQPEGVRQEPQDGTQVQPTEEAGVGDSILGAARGQEKGQVVPTTQPTISEIPPTSELVGAEPTQPTIREVPEISPIVGAEPAAIVEQEPVAPAEPAQLPIEEPPVKISRGENFSMYGEYDVSIGDKKHRIYRDPERGYWYDADVQEEAVRSGSPKQGSPSLGLLSTETRKDAIAELVNKYKEEQQAAIPLEAPTPVTTPPVTEAVTPAAEQPATPIPASGKPFEFFSIRNKEKAPRLGTQFGQDVEPSGKYISQSTPDAAKNLDARFEKKAVRFENPLVVEFGGEYGTATNWKNVLSSQYGGKTGKQLSQAIRDAGYDGIVTVEPAKGPNRPASTSEIVDISSLKPKKQAAEPAPVAPAAEVAPVAGDVQPASEPKAQQAISATSEAISKKEPLPQTRGKGIQYHGARGPIESIVEGYYSSDNIYGGEDTFYTTDALEIAAGYQRKKQSGVIYRVDETAPVNFFNMEERKPKSEWLSMFEGMDEFFNFAVEGIPNETPNLREIMDEMRAESANEGLSKDDVQEIFGSITYRLDKQGYGGMTHIGGLKTNREPHTVKIYFNPSKQISISLEDVTNLSQKPTTPAPAPAPAAAPTGITVGNRIKLGKSPQTYTIEEVIPQSATERDLGEQYYSVKNERTGETQVVEARDLKQVKGKGARKTAAATRNEEYMRLAQNPEANREQLQRMVDEAAKVAGYNVKGYHGTNADFDVFKPSKYGANGPGIYFSNDKDLASFGKRTISAWIKNPIFAGYEIIAKSPEQIKSADPVTRDDAGNVIPLEERFQPTSPDIRRQAIDTTPENILTTPPDQQYTFNEVFDVAYDMFGGEIPEGFTIVNDSTDKDFEFKAAYIPESGEIIVNLAYLNKSDDIRDTITHELGHYIFGDPEFRAAFDQFIASLSPEARAELDSYVETAYNKETGEIRLEEKMVRAFVDQFISEEQAPAWRSMLDAIKRFLNKLGFKFNISDRDAISVFTAALDRYKAGEAISREGGARLMAVEPAEVTPADEARREQVAGMKIGRIITTPPGIKQKTTDIIRSKFFDSTKVSPESTSQAWAYISQFMDKADNSNNKFAGYVNNVTELELPEADKRGIDESIGAVMLQVELANYAGRLATQGDTKMLSYIIRNGNRMPTGEYSQGVRKAGKDLNAVKDRLKDQAAGFAAFNAELKSNVERLASTLFGTNNPNEDQIAIAQQALTDADNIELGDANQVAADIKEVEGRTKTNLIDKVDANISQAIDKSGKIKDLEKKATRPRSIESQTESVIESLQRSLGELPPLPQNRESEIRVIVKQDLRQNPDMGRREPWNNMLVGRLIQAGVTTEQAQTIADLTWKQHEQKAINRELKELRKAVEEGSLAVIIDRIKNTPLEKQQSPEWKKDVIMEYLREAGLSTKAAETAANLYDSVISERLAAAKQKAFEATLAKAAPWKDYASRNSKLAKDALKKVQDAIRTGVLDPDQTTESIIAAQNGWTGFTKEQYQRIVEIDTILNDPNQDDITKKEALAELNKIITEAKLPAKFKEAIADYYIGQALLGIPTFSVNMVSPAGFSIRNLVTDISRYAFTDPKRIPIAFESFLDSMRSWYGNVSYSFRTEIYPNDVVEYLQGGDALKEIFNRGKKQWSEGKYAEGFGNMAVGMAHITKKVLSALDQGAISMIENQNLTRYAMEALSAQKKIPKDQIRAFGQSILAIRNQSIAQSVSEGMPRDRAIVLADLAAKSELIYSLSRYEISPDEVLSSAINDALQSVGRNRKITINGIEQSDKDISDTGTLTYLPIRFLEMIAEKSMQSGPAMQVFSKMVYGFALIPARVFSNVAWFSPVGAYRFAVDAFAKSQGWKSPYAMSLGTGLQYRQRLTETIAGSIAMLGLVALRSDSTEDDEDKKFKIVITGNGPNAVTDKQYYDSWIKKWKPYSIHIVVDGKIIPINIGRGGEALFFPIMLAGALDDLAIKKKQNLTKKEPEDLVSAVEVLGSSFFALAQRGPYAAFTKPLFDASKQGRVTEELASQAGYFGKTFIPVLGTSLARNITDFINDPVDRSSIEGAIYANTPVVGPWLGTKALNALGQPIRADDWGDKLFKLGVPVVFSFPKNTPENALNELILKQGGGPTVPTRSNAQKRFGDVLTDKEFEAYVREYGKVMSDKMFKSRTKLANMKPADYDDELEKYARGYSIDGIKIKGASDSAVLAVKRMRQ